MLLFDDDDVLPDAADDGELRAAATVGPEGLRAIDAALMNSAQERQLKVARVVIDAMTAAGYPRGDEHIVRLHLRRLIGLVESEALEGFGNLRRPRFSEVRRRPE